MSWLSRVVRYTNLHKLITEKDERDDHDGKELARPWLAGEIPTTSTQSTSKSR